MVVLKTVTCVMADEISRHQISRTSTQTLPKCAASLTCYSSDGLLAVTALELLHEGHQRVHAFLGERIVNGRTDPAHGAMPFQPVKSGHFRLLDERFLQFFARQPERDVHQRPAVLLPGSA